jgi:hypothetical protein
MTLSPKTCHGIKAQNASPFQDPILRIDPGMHTAPIKGIGVDAACTLLATGSECCWPELAVDDEALATYFGGCGRS